MLDQVTYWTEIAATAFDAFLLLRILSLRLHRVYMFVTLLCVLTLLMDGVDLWLEKEPLVSFRVFLFMRFIYAFLFPLVAWDVFEEIKNQVAKLRRLAMGRLISGLIFAALFGLVMAAFVDNADNSSEESAVLVTVGFVLWAGASTASFTFLLTMLRLLRVQPIQRPHNTDIWLRYYLLFFAGEAISCFALLILPELKIAMLNAILSLTLMGYGMAITGWCIWKLRPIPSGEPSASESAPL